MADSEHSKADERRLADLIAGNQRAEAELAAKGVRMGSDAVTQLQVRALLRLVVTEDRRMEWDIAYQEAVRDGLAEVAADLARKQRAARLLVPNGVPIPPPPG